MSMTKSKHTPEPWKATEGWCGDMHVSGPSNEVVVLSDESNAPRIVECVNAMAGVDDPQALRRVLDGLRDAWEFGRIADHDNATIGVLVAMGEIEP